MSTSTGRFVWYELMTTDVAGACEFYAKVVGWKLVDAKMPGMTYWMFEVGDTHVAAAMDLPEEARKHGARPGWVGYVAVDDVDASAAKVKANGGAIHVPPQDIPEVGRFAIIADPEGTSLALFKSNKPDSADKPGISDEPGRVGWHELNAIDHSAELDFFSKIFGWQKKESMDMGPMGTYQMFGTSDQMLGGMMNKPPTQPAPQWNYYFTVDNIDAAAERVKAANGKVVDGPHEVPGGGFIISCVDPQGGSFSLVGKR